MGVNFFLIQSNTGFEPALSVDFLHN